DQKSREKARRCFDAVRQRAFHFARKEGALGLRSEDIIIDIPKPPTSTKLGEGILVEIVSGYVVPLSELFPFEKVVKNYSKHYKYRSYVFAPRQWKAHVAYGAMRGLAEASIRLN